MKLLTYKLKGDDKERLGMMCSFAFHRFIPIEDLGLHFRDMNDLIQMSVMPGYSSFSKMPIAV